MDNKILLKNVLTYVDEDKIELLNIYIENGVITELTKNEITKQADIVIDGKNNLYVLPGFFDMHVHFRDFNEWKKETLESGSLAALKGGFTGVAIMPNTNPPIDTPEIIKEIKYKSKNLPIEIFPFACLTKARKGEEISEMFALKNAGAIGFSDDGDDIKKSDIMYNAINYAKMTNLAISLHCEDRDLSEGGHINEGKVSSKWGIKGIPDISESIAIYRNIAIAEFLDAKIHIAHVSTKASVEVIRNAKKRGVKITAETAPHYFSLTEDVLLDSLDANFKMNPPLRTEEDKLAIIEALKDGTIDVIATDHAPHGASDKQCEFEFAKFGIIGLETAFSVTATYLYHKEKVSIKNLVDWLSFNPRKILNLPLPKISVGTQANLVVVDLNEEIIYTEDSIISKSKNSPFLNKTLKGKVYATIFGTNKYINK